MVRGLERTLRKLDSRADEEREDEVALRVGIEPERMHAVRELVPIALRLPREDMGDRLEEVCERQLRVTMTRVSIGSYGGTNTERTREPPNCWRITFRSFSTAVDTVRWSLERFSAPTSRKRYLRTNVSPHINHS